MESNADLTVAFGPDVDRQKIITIVSGLPRSGTSMMMQMLAAAGREPLMDGKRSADEDNPLGYFEFEKAQALAKDTSWLPQARGRVVKIVAQLLASLPRDEHFQIIFMQRDLDEIVASQKAMLERQGRRGAEINPQQLQEIYAAQIQRIRAHLSRRPEIRILSVNYGELVNNGVSAVGQLALFLGDPFDRDAAVRAIRPELRRQRPVEA
jgi:hypothetical protein